MLMCFKATSVADRVETSAKSCQLRRGLLSHTGRSDMDWDEVRPKPAKGVSLGEDLSRYSVAELEARIVALQQEIARVEAELAAKKAHEAAAAALFKR